MKRALSLLLLASVAAFNLNAAEEALPEPVAPLSREHLTLVHTVDAIDRDILSMLNKQFHGVRRLANPKERYEATDQISDASLPSRRLILAGLAPNCSFVAYEHGGRGYHLHFIVFRRDHGTWQIAYNGTGWSDGNDLDSLLKAIRNRRLRDDPRSNEF